MACVILNSSSRSHMLHGTGIQIPWVRYLLRESLSTSAANDYIAACREHTACVKLLLSASSDVNKCNENGASLIHIVAQRRDKQCADHFMEL